MLGLKFSKKKTQNGYNTTHIYNIWMNKWMNWMKAWKLFFSFQLEFRLLSIVLDFIIIIIVTVLVLWFSWISHFFLSVIGFSLKNFKRICIKLKLCRKNPTIALKWWGLLFNTQSINNEAEFAFKFWILNFKIGPIFFFALFWSQKKWEKNNSKSLKKLKWIWDSIL